MAVCIAIFLGYHMFLVRCDAGAGLALQFAGGCWAQNERDIYLHVGRS